MDRGGEEETESEERRRNQSKEDESRIGKIFELIPLDLIPDIILRLPAKSAVRFRVVSKLWSSIITRPDFIRSFAFHSSTRLCLMACVKARDKRLFISLRQHDDASYSHVDRCQINFPEHDDGYYYDPCSESVHGLVCFGDFYKIIVWNPSMRQHVTLPEPKPRVRYFIRSCLGHDPVEDKYKVLSISGYHKGHHDPLVFTLGPQESWRVVQNSPSHIPLPTMGRVGTCNVRIRSGIPPDGLVRNCSWACESPLRPRKIAVFVKAHESQSTLLLLSSCVYGCNGYTMIRFVTPRFDA